MHIDCGDEKREVKLLVVKLGEQVDESGGEESGDAQDDPGPRDWDYMYGLRKGGLPLEGQGGCEVTATAPLMGAGKKGRGKEFASRGSLCMS